MLKWLLRIVRIVQNQELKIAENSDAIGADGKLRNFSMILNFRKLVVRYEYYAENYLAIIQLGCCIIQFVNPASLMRDS